MEYHSSQSTASEPTSLKGIALDALTSIVFLGGTWIIEASKKLLLPDGIPLLANIILIISELTLVLYFVGALFRALAAVTVEFERLTNIVGKGNSWQGIKRIIGRLQSNFDVNHLINRKSVSSRILSRLKISFSIAFIVTIWSGIIIYILGLSTTSLIILIASASFIVPLLFGSYAVSPQLLTYSIALYTLTVITFIGVFLLLRSFGLREAFLNVFNNAYSGQSYLILWFSLLIVLLTILLSLTTIAISKIRSYSNVEF